MCLCILDIFSRIIKCLFIYLFLSLAFEMNNIAAERVCFCVNASLNLTNSFLMSANAKRKALVIANSLYS